jgi:DNA-binding response OmpR family regulator
MQTKPIQPRELMAAIREALNAREAAVSEA